ncbi:MAG: rod shape-determining protein RodA [Gammaproteobacteria bacterium]|nr:MAG: rod shape-determining protein RodA [Gammaproteobacteria bacterium]RLA54030.1 MAG: rod shape-determining protein RodA [Gammaproteobacteria bacterium]
MKQALLLLTISMLASSLWATSSSPADAVVYIISPQNGETVQSPVTIKFGLKGMGVAPAGVDKPDTGHHHLLIDLVAVPTIDAPIASDDQHRHFGGGQTETEVELSPGQHTLQLLLGDKNHIPHDKPVLSEKITINVK